LGLFPLSHQRWIRAAQLAFGLALLYWGADTALNRFAFSHGWTILWPLNGVTIALLLMRRQSDWPPMLLGVAFGTGVGECLNHNPIGFEVLQRIISLSEVLLSAWLLPPFVTFETWLRSRFISSRFLAALLLGPGLSAIPAAVQLHLALGQSYGTAFNSWATADALGIASTMPLVLSLRSPEMWRLFQARSLARTSCVLAFALGVAGIIFSVSHYPLLFLLFPLLLLVESLLGFAGSAVAIFGICLLAVYTTTHAIGPFGAWPAGLAISGDVALQLYLGFNLVALFPASVRTMERMRMSEELRQTNQQLKMLASIDGLTGLANRRVLDEAFEKEWKRAIRLQTPLALLMVDIDHFKQFNDLYGHHTGDLCLKAVADILKTHLHRAQDLAARFGGEEFALLLPHTSLKDACDLAEKVRSAVFALSLRHDGSPFDCVTVSIGCSAATPAPGDSHIELLQSADSALYVAKQVGRNCVQLSPDSPQPVHSL
jgi:diguanylate cyclase (GGDEF)-like protein